jgi:hypothetical protein
VHRFSTPYAGVDFPQIVAKSSSDIHQRTLFLIVKTPTTVL